MIKVLFAPGSYGTYLARCLYNYTDLRSESFIPFTFDDYSSNHQYRQDKIANTKINAIHLDSLIKINPTDIIVTLVPDTKHNLDYCNNQCFKQYRAEPISYILTHFLQGDVDSKLFKDWNYFGPLDNKVPIWMLREWCSYWITDLWNIEYNRKNYLAVTAGTQVEVTDLIDQFDQTFIDIVNKLGLTVNINSDIIYNTHKEFVNKQRFHNSQINCNQWATSTMNANIDLPMPALTIFEEAYIQHLLRQQGYKIKCDGLNKFPTTTSCLKKIIYKI
jgi:hypothetical protein